MDSFCDSDSRSGKYHVEGMNSLSGANKVSFQHELAIPESLRILTDPRQDFIHFQQTTQGPANRRAGAGTAA